MFLLRRALLPKFSFTAANKYPFKNCIKPQWGLSRSFSTPSDGSSEYEGIKKALEADNERRSLTDQEGPLKSERRLVIGFTCKKCNHRTHRTMSHHAYNHGIVLIECPGCQSRHLIADNLGWFKDTPNAARKIEEMTVDVGEIRRNLKISEKESEGLVELLKD